VVHHGILAGKDQNNSWEPMLIPPDGMLLIATINIYIYYLGSPWHMTYIYIYINNIYHIRSMISQSLVLQSGRIFFALSSARLAQRRASPGHDLKLSCPRQNDVLGGPEICQFFGKKRGTMNLYIYYIYI
jgi:hypothetical protein